MPELPEVETVARQLAPLLAGRRVRAVQVLDAKLESPQLAALAGQRIVRVYRLGKRVAIALGPARAREPSQAQCVLLVHLRMSGRLIWTPGRTAPEQRHLRARFMLDGGALLFNDPRRFGTLEVVPVDAAQPGLPAELPGAGVEPLGSAFTKAKLAALLGSSRQALKPWLLRQDKLAGIGNIYASEILFAARLHPARPAGSLKPGETARLYAAIRRVLKLAIKHCGTTFSDFQDAHGAPGGFRRLLKVYGREGQPCRACGAPVLRVVQQQRGTFYCPACQRDAPPHPAAGITSCRLKDGAPSAAHLPPPAAVA